MDMKILAFTVDEQEVKRIRQLLNDLRNIGEKSIDTDKIDVLLNELDNISDNENALSLAGKTAGICYMGDDYLSNAIQNKDTAVKRARGTAKKGHHSIYDHGNVTLLISGIPKIIAMLLNNTQFYTTSEKSARYTLMKPETDMELDLYNKWVEKFKVVINELYPEIDKSTVVKLAQENARYLISVFTPTVMAYTTSNRQLGYLVDWCDKLPEQLREQGLVGDFYDKVCGKLKEFKCALLEEIGEPIIKDNKNRGFNLFTPENDNVNEIFDDVYKLHYKATFAELAQAQRHRTITHQISIGRGNLGYYVPKCIRDTELEQEWVTDIASLAYCYPQGTLVEVTERGIFENFILKAKERLCGRAQLEICNVTEHYMDKFIENKSNLSSVNRELLDRNTGEDKAVTKCLMDNFKCTEVCRWGNRRGLTRLI